VVVTSRAVLIVGATGQLGTAVLRRLVKSERPVRALIRPSSPHGHLEGPGVEIALGDLRDTASLDAACRGVGCVVATANAVIPRGRSSFREVEQEGYRNLIGACRRAGVPRLIFMSVPVLPGEERVPTFRIKRQIEAGIRESGLAHTIFRGSLFMDDWFALMGSSIPLRGAEAHTLQRPFWFSEAFRKMTGRAIEGHGLALVAGTGQVGHAFIALDDVADFLAAAAVSEGAPSETLDIGGPEILSWNDAAALFARVLGRRVRVFRTPAGVYRALAALLAPVSPPASNLMAMSWLTAIAGTPFDTREAARRFGVRPTSAEEFLRRKAALSEGSPA
jgi:uncharacterized protein YbjT (DUF2867 family)